MSKPRITLLAQDLAELANAVPPEVRQPGLERVFARGRPLTARPPTPDHLRFRLFGIEAEGALPVAALTRASDRGRPPRRNRYWLRADPVTLRADMARVFMIAHGYADLDTAERDAIGNRVCGVLAEEGIELCGGHAEHWCIPLSEPLPFAFTPLPSALGVDMAEVLPEHPEARFWRRVMNEIQVDLHNCPVNVERRRTGRPEINSVWFWGGGFMPPQSGEGVFDLVYSTHPVTTGLAILNEVDLRKCGQPTEMDWNFAEGSVLVDWSVRSGNAATEIVALERFVAGILDRVHRGEATLELFDGSGIGRQYARLRRLLSWRRRRPVSNSLELPRS